MRVRSKSTPPEGSERHPPSVVPRMPALLLTDGARVGSGLKPDPTSGLLEGAPFGPPRSQKCWHRLLPSFGPKLSSRCQEILARARCAPFPLHYCDDYAWGHHLLTRKLTESIGSASDAVPCGEWPEIAVIVPVYNGRPMLEELCRRLVDSVDSITGNFSVILIDDASPDNCWPLICKLGERDTRIKGLRLSRNFGQHYALTAGIDLARARWYVIMDCDLQDAPEDIPLLYSKAIEGHNLVAGMRRKEGHGVIKRYSSRLFYALFRILSGVQLDWSVGNFRIFSDTVAEGFRSMREQMRFLPASFEWMGFNPPSTSPTRRRPLFLHCGQAVQARNAHYTCSFSDTIENGCRLRARHVDRNLCDRCHLFQPCPDIRDGGGRMGEPVCHHALHRQHADCIDGRPRHLHRQDLRGSKGTAPLHRER